MKSWSSSTGRPQPSAIPDSRRPNIRIGRGSARGVAKSTGAFSARMEPSEYFVVHRQPEPFIGQLEVPTQELERLHFVVKFDPWDGIEPSAPSFISERLARSDDVTVNVSRRGRRSRARDRTINRVRTLGRRRWKKVSGYHRQARVENTFFRYKVIIGDGLRARSPGGQGSEAVLACKILNRMTALGRPASYSIGR